MIVLLTTNDDMRISNMKLNKHFKFRAAGDLFRLARCMCKESILPLTACDVRERNGGSGKRHTFELTRKSGAKKKYVIAM